MLQNQSIFHFLLERFEEYLNKANEILAPIYLSLSSIIATTDSLLLKHLLAMFGAALFIVFIAMFYPKEMKIAKKLKKYFKNEYPEVYAYLDGTIRYVESWEFSLKKGLPFVSSYSVFFTTWIVTT